MAADEPGRVSFTARLASSHRWVRTAVRAGDQLALLGEVEEGGVRFEGRLTPAPVTSKLGQPCRVRYGQTVRERALGVGETGVWNGK